MTFEAGNFGRESGQVSHYGLSQLINTFCKLQRQGRSVTLQTLLPRHELTPDERSAVLDLDWEALARLGLHPILRVKLKAATRTPLADHE